MEWTTMSMVSTMLEKYPKEGTIVFEILSATDIIALLPVAYLVLTASALIVFDVTQRRLPNRIVLPGIVLALVAESVVAGVNGQWLRFALVVLMSLAFAVAGTLASSRGYVGMGDVKLLALVSLSLGWFSLWFPLIAIGVTAGLAALVVGYRALVVRNLTSTSTIALGPLVVVGFAATCVVALL
jgi:leader peptidase (prepilin peptidase)/N-methyltransferase